MKTKQMQKHKLIGSEDVETTRAAAILKYKLGLERAPQADLSKWYVGFHQISGPSERNLGLFYAAREIQTETNEIARIDVCFKRIRNYVQLENKGRDAAAAARHIEAQAVFEAYVLHTVITDHPCIVRLNRVLRDAEQAFWLEFEWISSASALYTSGNPAETWPFLHDVASALSYCHARGVVHCDIKLDNIMRRGDRFVLIDFGSACFVDNGVAAPRYEVNPVGHRPPETLLGLPWNDRVDVWSLACSAVEFFCAARKEAHPFLYDGAASIEEHMLTVARLIGRIPAVMTMHLTPEQLGALERAAAGGANGAVCPGMEESDPGLSRLIRTMMAALPQDRPSATAVVMKVTDIHKKNNEQTVI